MIIPEGEMLDYLDAGLELKKIAKLVASHEEMRKRLRTFKITGTDRCVSCDTGRVSLWKQYIRCLDCQAK